MKVDGAQVHLALNHLPVIVPLIGAGILFYGMLKKSDEVKNVALFLYMLAALVTVPTYLSGGYAADIIKNFPGISREAIRQHEMFAFYALIGLEVLGAFSLGLLLAGRKFRRATWALLLLSLFLIAGVFWTAHLGGEIRHEEIQSGRFLEF